MSFLVMPGNVEFGHVELCITFCCHITESIVKSDITTG